MSGVFNYVAEIYNRTKFDFLYGDCIITDMQNKPIRYGKSYYTNHVAQALGLVTLFQPSCFWSSRIYYEINGLDPNFLVTMDGDLFYRILKQSRKSIRINKPLSTFRIHPGQSGSWAPKGRYQQERKILYEREANNVSFIKIYSYFFKIKVFLYRLFKLA